MTRNLSWPAVALVAVLGALALGLLIFTDLTGGAVLGIIGVLAGIGTGQMIAAGPLGQAQRMEEIHAETMQQTPLLETVARRVNGELDGRIEAAVEAGNGKVVAEIMSALTDAGVIRRG